MAPSLPAELIQMILEDKVLTRSDLKILRQANRFFHSIATPLLFEVLAFAYWRPTIQSFFLVIRDPSLSKHVRRIAWDDRKVTTTKAADECKEDLLTLFDGCYCFEGSEIVPNMPEYAAGEKEVGANFIPDVEALREALRRLPNLQAIRLFSTSRRAFNMRDVTSTASRPESTAFPPYKLQRWSSQQANQYGPESIWSLGNNTYVPGLQRGFSVVIMALSMEKHTVQELQVCCDRDDVTTGLDHKVFMQPPISKDLSKAFGQLRRLELCLGGNLVGFGGGQPHVHRLAAVFRALRRCQNLEHLGITGPFLSASCRPSISILVPVLERLVSLRLNNVCIFREYDVEQPPIPGSRPWFSSILVQVLGHCDRLTQLNLQAPWFPVWSADTDGAIGDLSERPGSWSYIIPEDKTWTSLEQVSMLMVVTHIEQFCGFLSRHRNTLKEVKMAHCQLYDNARKNLSLEVLGQRLNEVGLKYKIQEPKDLKLPPNAPRFVTCKIHSIK